jgi:hypothetical protein
MKFSKIPIPVFFVSIPFETKRFDQTLLFERITIGNDTITNDIECNSCDRW